jgi:hypothetical protein
MGGTGDFLNFNSSRQQRIRDERTMTAPGNGFRAHNCHPFRSRRFYQIVEIFLELGRLHVIGETTEAGVTPTGIRRIRPRMAEATQSRHVPVMKASRMQGIRQLASVELRIVTRTRNGAYID